MYMSGRAGKEAHLLQIMLIMPHIFGLQCAALQFPFTDSEHLRHLLCELLRNLLGHSLHGKQRNVSIASQAGDC
jgi:hypothetical protein